MTDEELDRIERAEEIQRYTENRCEALEKENTELKTQVQLLQMNIEKMNCSGNCHTWNEWQCPYARNREKEYVHPNMDECPCDKWKIKVVEAMKVKYANIDIDEEIDRWLGVITT